MGAGTVNFSPLLVGVLSETPFLAPVILKPRCLSVPYWSGCSVKRAKHSLFACRQLAFQSPTGRGAQ